MCLIVKKDCKQTNKDIVCYKIVERRLNENDEYEYESAFMHSHICVGNIEGLSLESELKTIEDIKSHERHCGLTKDSEGYIYMYNEGDDIGEATLYKKDVTLIFEGMFHSFKTLEDTVKSTTLEEDVRIIKCIIPKGSYLYEGNSPMLHDDDKFFADTYASTKITYEKDITDEVKQLAA